MTWSFYGGTTDPAKRTRENMVFAFAMVAIVLQSAARCVPCPDPRAYGACFVREMVCSSPSAPIPDPLSVPSVRVKVYLTSVPPRRPPVPP